MDTIDRRGKNVTRKKAKVKDKPFLPDEIITNILTRLPAKDTMRCRLVCRRWRDLTMSRDFVDLHFRPRISPMIFVSKGYNLHRSLCPDAFDHLVLDKWWEPARTKLMIHRFSCDPLKSRSHYRALFSHDGMIVLRKQKSQRYSQPKFIILNPINGEKVKITLCKELLWSSEIYGVYFHPSLKEYCSLLEIKTSDGIWSSCKQIQYKILKLGSNPSMKAITNPFSDRLKKHDTHPLFIGKYLYWILGFKNDIMEFDIITQEFKVMPCPEPLDSMNYECSTHLLNIDGTLSFLLIRSPREALTSMITVWSLENHAEQLWTSANYTLNRKKPKKRAPRAIAVVDGKLALVSDNTLLVCHLMQGTVDEYKREYTTSAFFFSYQMSLASLKDCQSTISIGPDGELVNISEPDQ